jgi:hypothetical protein
MFGVTYVCLRNKNIWGEDADVWRPSRWLDGTVKSPGSNVGVWANLCGEVTLSIPVTVSNSVLGCLLVPDIVHVSGGDSRKYPFE